MNTTQITLAEVFKIMTDSNVDTINIDFDVDDIPVRLKIKLTVRGYEVEWKNDEKGDDRWLSTKGKLLSMI